MNFQKIFSGVYTELITPFWSNQIDFESLENLIDLQIKSGINGLVITDISGEGSTLTEEEKRTLVQSVVKQVNGKIPVVASIHYNGTENAIHWTKVVDAIGVDALLIITPFFNRPTQEGLFLHFSKIAEVTKKPILLHSSPLRCGVEISLPILQRLSEKFPHIVGIKESGGSCNRVSEMIKALGPKFIVLSGDDCLNLPFLAIGGCGSISVASNLYPQVLLKMVNCALNNNLEQAAEINKKYYLLFKCLSLDASPASVKEALFHSKQIRSPELRLPLAPMSAQNRSLLIETIKGLNP